MSNDRQAAPTEQEARRRWDASPAVRAEFGEFYRYFAYVRAEARRAPGTQGAPA
jgi:hypothetical protein